MSAKSRGSVASSAKSRVEYYMRAESRLSTIPKPEQQEDETKGAYGWRVVRNCVKEAIDLTMKADTKDIFTNHGIQHSRKINHPYPIQDMVYNKSTKEFISVDGRMLRVYKSDGRKKDLLEANEEFNRLVHSTHNNLFVGWTDGSDKVVLLNSQFEVSSCSFAPGPLYSAVYNENVGEIMTIGKGFLMSWVFRYGGRHLLPRKTSQFDMLEDNDYRLMVLEETASRSQRGFAVCGTTVLVFNLYEGTLIGKKKELHERSITALLFFNPLKYLVTGSRDGSIKVWDSHKWHLQLVFVGHQDEVSALAVYPYGPNIMSASHDNTIRVWSLETCDEVDKKETPDPVLSLGTVNNHDHFFSYTHQFADIWKVNHVHALHSRINHKTNLLKATDHPEHPIRNVAICNDSSVRILSPSTGDIITTLLQPKRRGLVDAAYAIADDTVFACFKNGDIVKADTSTNPCTIVSEWPCNNPDKACNYLLVYEYVITADVSGDVWGGIRRMAGAMQQTGADGSSEGDGATSGRVSATSSTKRSANRTLLLGGRKDGHICVFNMLTGKIEFEIEGHGVKGVLSMMANSKADQLISAGLDNIIKIWRLYPYAQESLAPLLSFYCAHTPIYMCVLKNKLAVAFQEHTTATYSVVMYNLSGKNRADHGPEDDHMDSITGLTSCQKLRLLASASHDGTIRIWNENNVLVRCVNLNAQPHSVSFCSKKGDLLVGIGDHIHKIDYKHYMPRSYRFKMVSMQFSRIEEEKALPFDENLVNLLSKDDQRRLKNARSSFKFTHFVDVLTDAETEEVMREKKLREKAFSLLEERDNELMKIRDGEQEAKKKPKPTAATKRRAFDKYLRIFYNRPDFKIPEEDPYEKDRVAILLQDKPKKVEEEWKPEREPTGFFPSASLAVKPAPPEEPTKELTLEPIKEKTTTPEPVIVKEPIEEPIIEKEPTAELERILSPKPPPSSLAKKPLLAGPLPPSRQLSKTSTRMTPSTPLRADGFIPNSVLVRLLWPRDETQESEQDSTYRPPTINDRMLKTMQANKDDPDAMYDHSEHHGGDGAHKHPHKKRVKSKKFNERGTDRTLVLDYSDEEEAKAEDDDDALSLKDPSEMPNTAFMQKVQGVMEREPTPVEEPEPVFLTQPEQEEEPKEPEKVKAKKVVITPQKKLTKFVSKGPPPPKPASPPPPPPIIKHPTPPPPRTPTPPPPPTPLPEFITQFKGQTWFDKYFPNCNTHTMPKPWTVSAFVTMLVRVLKIAEYEHKNDVLEALSSIHAQEGIPNVETVTKAIYGIFNHSTKAPTCLDPTQKQFISLALTLLQSLGHYDKEFFTELMVQFLDADRDVRNQVLDTLKNIGMKDPHNYFPKELDSWDTWNLDEKDRSYELRKMCQAWLDRYMTSFKIHVEDSIERLKAGKAVHGRATPQQISPAKAKSTSPNRSIMKKPSLAGLAEEGEVAETLAPKPPSSTRRASHTPAQSAMTVTFEHLPDLSSLDNASYLEAINYFCEMELEKMLERMRNGGAPMEKGAEHKNTVLVLPKLQGKGTLVRLGETHTSQCRPRRETSLAIDLRLPPVTTRGKQPPPGQLYGFPNAINLPMKQVAMNPFPSAVDDLDIYHEPVLLTLKSSQKYFVHERSYVPADVY